MAELKSFVLPSIPSFPTGQLADNDPTRTPQYRTVSYEGKRNNPVNMDYVISFYPEELAVNAGSSKETYPAIRFVHFQADGRDRFWYYPPSVEGRKARDSDLNYLTKLRIEEIPDPEKAAKVIDMVERAARILTGDLSNAISELETSRDIEDDIEDIMKGRYGLGADPFNTNPEG